jgi:hypothetical protein
VPFGGAAASVVDVVSVVLGDVAESTGVASRGRWWRGCAAVAPVYLALALFLWWGVWWGHPTATTICGCGDGARFLWFFEWPAYALRHGHSVLYSPFLFHPTGINLLNDTSVLGLGFVLTPVTLAFGPVASMNVALTLAPALSALTMFVLLTRFVRWRPAAFVGGLVYGFSPFLLTELALNQLNIAFLGLLPLIVLMLDDLLIRQKHRPARMGGALAVLLALQFFVSTEVFLITVAFGLVGVAFVVAFAWLHHRGEVHAKTAHAVRGLLVASGVAVALLAYPLWFLLRGPAHLSGPIWSNGSISQYGNTLGSFVRSTGLGQVGATMTRFGGYQGSALPGLGYLGVGVVVVAVAGTLVWRHDRRLLLFGGLGIVAAVLSLGTGQGYWVPWQAIEKIPWIGDIVEIRFTVVLSLCAAVMVAVVVDRCRSWIQTQPHATRRPGAGALAGALAMVMLIPTALVLGPNVPFTTRAVVLPPWFATVGTTLPPGRVVLTYPAPFSGLQSSQAWQAVDDMRWAQAGGGGPEGQPSRAGAARGGFEVLLHASLPLGPAPGPTPANLSAVREALAQWRVTTVVVPDQEQLPLDEQGRSSAYAVGLFTAVLGVRPTYSHSAWVWSDVVHGAAPLSVAANAFSACITAAPTTPASPQGVASCVLQARR